MEELRKQLDDEKEAACARERDNAQKRFEKQVEQEENAYQQQRRRLYAEVRWFFESITGFVLYFSR